MARQGESALKTEMKRYVESRGGFWSLIPQGGMAKVGDPDIIVCYKGMYIGLEAKMPNGTQSYIQKTRQREIEDAGGIYLLARSNAHIERVFGLIDEGVASATIASILKSEKLA